MIGNLKGIIEIIDKDHLVVDVNGVGYIAYCSGKNMANVKVGDKISLFIETIVREDQITLYGFFSYAEKQCFLELIKVNGLGAKIALNILNYLSPEQIYQAICLRDSAAFIQISGVGKKIVERIFTELQNKPFIKNFAVQLPTDRGSNFKQAMSMEDDAVSALVNLGIRKTEAKLVVSSVLAESMEYNLDEVIRLSLSKVSN